MEEASRPNRLTEAGVVAALITLLGLMWYWPSKSPDYAEAVAKSRAVKIEAVYPKGIAQGTGTLVGHNRILTNAHLFPTDPELGGNPQVYFRRFSDTAFTPAIIISSNTADLSILRFQGPDNTRPLKIMDQWHLGEPILLLGNPREADFVVGHTRIIGLAWAGLSRKEVRPMLVYPCDEGRPGFSGSGIYNMNGEFLGIFELAAPAIGACMAIPSKEILEKRLNTPWVLEAK